MNRTIAAVLCVTTLFAVEAFHHDLDDKLSAAYVLRGLAQSERNLLSEKLRRDHSPRHKDPDPMRLTLFGSAAVQQFGARCLDGSPAGYYFRPGVESDKFVIFLQGGGLCITPVDCLRRAKGPLGSSKGWSSTHTDSNNVLSKDAANPFRSWNHIFVPYGSGDVYIGTQREKNEMGLYMAGHLTLEAIVSDLVNKTLLGKAHSVLLSGASAGGIGTFQNADWLGSRLRALSPQVSFKASPQAGAFFVNSKVEMMAQYTFGYRFGFNAAFLFADYVFSFIRGIGKHASDPFLDQSCMAAHPRREHQCWSADIHYRYIETPLYVAQNRFDSNQAGEIFGANWWPFPLNRAKHKAKEAAYLRYFGQQTVNGIGREVINQTTKRDGLFMPSCFQHTGNLCMAGGSLIQNVSYAQSLGDWFTATVDTGGSLPHQLLDDCNTKQGTQAPCNSRCVC